MRGSSGSQRGNRDRRGKSRIVGGGQKGGNRRLNGPTSLLRPIVEKFLLAKELLFDPATPWHVKLIMVGTLLYLLSPVDFIPDMIPILGITDDLAVLALAWSYCTRYATEAMWQRVDAILQRW